MFQLIPSDRRQGSTSAAPEQKMLEARRIFFPTANFGSVFLRRALVVLALVTFAVFLIHSASAINQDLGRHLKLGEIIWQTKSVPATNLFSYTHPDFPFINHHWLSEVIYYLLSLAVGIKGLIVFNDLIVLAAFALVWRLAWRRDYFIFSTLAAILGVGLMLERTEIRPESFGLLLFSLFLFILEKNKEKISWHFWLLLPLQLLWVNLHISFVYGLALAFFFFLDRLWARRRAVYLLAKQKKIDRYIFKIVLGGALMGAVCFLNPNTWRGALYPLFIFSNYGYTVVENQSPFFLEGLINNPTIVFFKITLAALGLAFVANLGRIKLFYWLSALLLVVMSWGAIRNFPLLGLVAILVLSDGFATARRRFSRYFIWWEKNRWRGVFRLLTLTLIFVILGAGIYAVVSNRFYLALMRSEQFGLGVPIGAGAAVDFLKQNNIQGPMFNNFDVGSFLIWRLWPEEKVFVDGRPEAYPADFLQNVYIPLQTDEATWQKYANEVYKINFVFFAHTDQTPWGREFLRQMTRRPDWTLVYVDSVAAIWVKNNDVNKSLTQKYALRSDNLAAYLEKYLASGDFFELLNLGTFFRDSGFSEPAIKCFDRALEINPDAKQIWLIGGALYETVGQIEKARDYFEKALKLDEDYVNAYLALGRLEYQQGNFSEARRAWQKALEIEPGNEAARAYLDNMGLIPFTK